MRYALIALSILMGTAAPTMAQVSVTVSIPGVSIGINQPVYPELVLVPGYPVYYAPQAQTNYFFYDGLYWVYQDDRWYSSSWYNGPWEFVEPDFVPLFILRVPVRYYVHPPVYFRGWVVTAPPRWDVYWGPRWVQHRHGWDHWDRRVVYAPAPLPVYQRHYVGDRYPRGEQQHAVREQNYRYQPHDGVVRQHYQKRAVPREQTPDRPGPQRGPDVPRAQQQSQGDREDMRRPAFNRTLPPPGNPAARVQRQQPREEGDRRAPASVEHAPRASSNIPRAQRLQDGPDMRRPAFDQPHPRQRAPEAVRDQRQQVQRQQVQQQQVQQQQVQQQQVQQQINQRTQQMHAPQSRGASHQPRLNAERSQGPRQGRGRENSPVRQ